MRVGGLGGGRDHREHKQFFVMQTLSYLAGYLQINRIKATQMFESLEIGQIASSTKSIIVSHTCEESYRLVHTNLCITNLFFICVSE